MDKKEKNEKKPRKKRFKLLPITYNSLCKDCEQCVLLNGEYYCCSETGEDGDCNVDNKKPP
jgi:hypothetical protein